jgi:hypothetical protein
MNEKDNIDIIMEELWSALTKSILSQEDDEGFSAEENLDCRRLLARMMGEKLAESTDK